MAEWTYSSYDLDKFQTCPKLWDLSRRWQAPEENWAVSLHLGAAVSVGLAALRRKKGEANARLAATEEMNRRFRENDEWTFDGVMKHVFKGMELGFSSNLGLKVILSADKQEYGRCRPDMVGRDHEGRLRIWDDKIKLKLDVKYLGETLSEFNHSNQVYEYAWEVGRYYNEPVYSVGINLIILTPSARVVPYPIILEEAGIEYWAKGAEADFDEMHRIESGLTMPRTRWTSCATKYNKPRTFGKVLCAMYVLCHDLHGDESKAEALYERR